MLQNNIESSTVFGDLKLRNSVIQNIFRQKKVFSAEKRYNSIPLSCIQSRPRSTAAYHRIAVGGGG